ncbi:MAG: HDIG domain-containing protein [Bacteroidales bacterium]|nr:HDIG domain-containing protein [Bacteroidales bacterium]
MRPLIQRLLQIHYELFKILPFIIVLVLIVWLMPDSSSFRYEFHLGKPWQHTTLIAPFDFTIHKSADRIEAERQQIADQVYPYFQKQDELVVEARKELEKKLNEQAMVLELENSQKQWILKLFDQVYTKGIIQHHQIIDARGKSGVLINLVHNKEVSTASEEDFFTIATAFEYCRQQLAVASVEHKEAILNMLREAMVQNIVFDPYFTTQATEQAWQRVSPVFGLVQKGELIISEGETVDEEKYLILSSLQAEFTSLSDDSIRSGTLIAGKILLVLIVLGILFYYLRIFKKNIFSELKKINLILLLLLLVVIPSQILLEQAPSLIYLFPYGMLPILLITFYDARTTFLVHLLTILLVAISMTNAFQFVFQQLIVGYVVVLSLADHNKRLYFFRASFLVFVGYILVFLGFNLMFASDFHQVEYRMLWIFAGSSMLTILALPLIFLIERMFGLVTDLSLLELSNTNSPLLHELASKAPGTFQHSMQVANLAEEALYEIGGDVLLARTGALYHDIGKMASPYFYIENQMGAFNPHDDLPPRESAAIIIGHVLKGINMARKAGLPDQIIEFIRTHHGTSRTNYFYMLEKRLHPGLTIDERDFRYRGPIPFSKETAVVMMADSVEAASRSMKEPNEQKINDLVENIINKQIEDGQFVNANITLRELNKVKKMLKKKLLNIYHVRIAYPG